MDLTKEKCGKYKQELQFAYDHVGTKFDEESIKDAISLGIVGYENLIKKYFELKDRYSKILDDVHDYRYETYVNKIIVRNLMEHFKVNNVEELQNIYLNKPYKLEELKEGMVVWYVKEKSYIKIFIISKESIEYEMFGTEAIDGCVFEKDCFYPMEVK